MDALKTIAQGSIKESAPEFSVGDTVKVSVNIREGERERIQMFEGTVIAKKGSGVAETFTLRRVSYGVGVERVFALHAPNVVDVKASFIISVTELVRQLKSKKKSVNKVFKKGLYSPFFAICYF